MEEYTKQQMNDRVLLSLSWAVSFPKIVMSLVRQPCKLCTCARRNAMKFWNIWGKHDLFAPSPPLPSTTTQKNMLLCQYLTSVTYPIFIHLITPWITGYAVLFCRPWNKRWWCIWNHRLHLMANWNCFNY